MSRTIGRRWPKSWRGQGVYPCAYCDAPFPRHKLTRLRNGLLACIDNDAIGRDEVELDEANAQAVSRYRGFGMKDQER